MYRNIVIKNSEWQKMAIPNFLQHFSPKRLEKIQNGQKWPFQIFSNNFSHKDWYKFGIEKNGHSKFFVTIFPKDWYKFRMAKNGCSKFFPTIFAQKDWYKFRMAKNGHSKFFPTIFPTKTGINLEWKKMAIPNFL